MAEAAAWGLVAVVIVGAGDPVCGDKVSSIDRAGLGGSAREGKSSLRRVVGSRCGCDEMLALEVFEIAFGSSVLAG